MTTLAEQVVDALFRDMADRCGFDTGWLDVETLASWKTQWAGMLASHLSTAESRGYARAREQAAGICDDLCRELARPGPAAACSERIRAMADDGASPRVVPKE